MKKASVSKTVVTEVGRTSFMSVFESRDNENYPAAGKEFSVTLLFSKDSDMSWIEKPWEEMIKEAWPGGKKKLSPLYAEADPYDDKGKIIDGDWKYESVPGDKKGLYEAYKGHWVVRVKVKDDGKSYNPTPKVVDENKLPITDESSFVSGHNARAVIQLSAFDSKEGRPVLGALKLVVIQRQPGGEPFGGGVSQDAALDMLTGGEAEDLL